MAESKPPGLGADANPSVFEQISSLCESFDEEFPAKRTQPASDRFLEYLRQVDGVAQPTLFRNILHNEVERRRQTGEKPRVEEYIDAVPHLAVLVHQVFKESAAIARAASTQMPPESVSGQQPVLEDSPAKPPPAETVDHVRLPAKFLGDFELLNKLGQGGMGMVYQARHLSRRDLVALKTLKPGAEHAANSLEEVGRLRRFKTEFRALADINHRHLVGLHALEEAGGQYFFTMDLIDGEDFLSFVRPNNQLDNSRLRSALSQLVSGVMALHGHNIVHRDLKQNNVMVDREGVVKILDFGLVADLDPHANASITVGFRGTPEYAAPEQLFGEQTFASDWYAVGVMLYEALAGHLPFRHADRWRILQDKQKQDAASIVGQQGVPDDLAQLCMCLLQREPIQRPQAADIAQIVSAEATLAKPAAEAELPLIGRDEQLAQLQAAHRFLAEQHEPLTVLVSGRSGEGKSYLIEHFLGPLQNDRRLTIISGRCYDRESVPFKALDRLIDALTSHLASLSDADAALLMPDDVSFLSHLFPVMKRVNAVAQSSNENVAKLDEQQVRQRAYAALRLLLRRIGRRTPVIMFIDDLQWGDSDSAEVMFQVLRPPEAPAVLFLGSYRSDEAEDSPFLKAWDQLQQKNNVQLSCRGVKVAPLNTEQCAELIAKGAGKTAPSLQDRSQALFEEAGGNPYLLMELMESFDQQSGQIRRIPLGEVIQRKLSNLPPEAEGLLEIVAVSGQALSLAEASKAAGHNSPAVSTITHMRTEKLVRLVGSDETPQVDTYHDKIRDTVLSGMEAKSKAATHLILANTIEADARTELEKLLATLENDVSIKAADRTHPRLYDLAYHFDAGGAMEKAWRYALLAAEQSRRQFALEAATEQFAIAKRNADEAPNAVLYRIAEGYGEALMLLGRYENAAKQFDGAIDLIGDSVSKATIEALQGELAFKQGDLNRSVRYFESGLRRLGNWVPQTLLGFGWGLARESMIQCWHTLFPGRLHKKRADSRTELTARLFTRQGYPVAFLSAPMFIWTTLAGVNRAQQISVSSTVALSYCWHGACMSPIGWHTRAFHYLDRSLELRRQSNDRWGQGQSLLWKGVGYWAAGNYGEGVTNLSQAVDLLDETGDLSELNFARFHLACCHYTAGNLTEAIAEARKTFELSVRIGDTRANCSLYLWSKASRGDLPFDELASRFQPNRDDILSTCNLDKGEGYWHLHHGRTEQAVKAFRLACHGPIKHHLLIYHSVAGGPAYVQGLRRHADTVEMNDPHEARRLRKRAMRVGKRVVWLTRLFPTEYPYAMRELGLVYAAVGRTKKSLKLLDKSRAVAQKRSAKFEYAQSNFERAKLAHQLGLPEAEEQLSAAKTELEKFDAMIAAAVETTQIPQTGWPLSEEHHLDQRTEKGEMNNTICKKRK